MSTKHSTEDTGPGTELVPVKFSRLTRRGILLGLSAAQLVTLGIGVLALVGAPLCPIPHPFDVARVRVTGPPGPGHLR